MSEVPGDDNFYTIDRCSSDMKSILWIFGWNPLFINNTLGKRSSIVVNIEHREFGNSSKSHLCLVWITSAGFFKDKC